MAARAKRPDASGWISLGGSSRQYRNIHTGEVLSRRAYREQHQLGGQRIESVVASRDLKNISEIRTLKSIEKQIALRSQLNNEIAHGNQVATKRKSNIKISKERINFERAKGVPTIQAHLYDNKGVLHNMTLTHAMGSSIGTYLEAVRTNDKGTLRLFSEMEIMDVETGKIITLPKYDQRYKTIIRLKGMQIEDYNKQKGNTRYAA